MVYFSKLSWFDLSHSLGSHIMKRHKYEYTWPGLFITHGNADSISSMHHGMLLSWIIELISGCYGVILLVFSLLLLIPRILNNFSLFPQLSLIGSPQCISDLKKRRKHILSISLNLAFGYWILQICWNQTKLKEIQRKTHLVFKLMPVWWSAQIWRFEGLIFLL